MVFSIIINIAVALIVGSPAAAASALRGNSMANQTGTNSSSAAMTAHRASILHFVDDPFKNTTDDGSAQYFTDGLLVLTADGHVEMVGAYKTVIDYMANKSTPLNIIDHRPHLIMPGFIDAHVHYTQETMTASYGEWLLPWLNRYAFPAESLFGQYCGFPFDSDNVTNYDDYDYYDDFVTGKNTGLTTSPECSAARLVYARSMSKQFMTDLLSFGTTTAAIFPTVYKESTEALFQEAAERNMRIITGKVGMDRTKFGIFDLTPTWLYDTAESFYTESKALIEEWHNKPGTRTLYAVTPRFAPSSTEEQLKAAGRLLKEHPSVYMQTHLAENYDEVALAENMYANLTPAHQPNLSYAQVYDHFGLITTRSLFGHSIHLSQADWNLLSRKGASVVHNPSSNLFLGSGLFNLAAANRSSVRTAVGSDIGAGTSLSTFETLKQAYNVASMAKTWLSSVMPAGKFPNNGVISISSQDVADPAQARAGVGVPTMTAPESDVPPNNISLSAAKAFYLATLGSAKALSLDEYIGNFKAGKEADFVVLDLGDSALPADRMAYARGSGEWWKQRVNATHPASDVHGPAAADYSRLWQKLFALMIMGGGREVAATYIMGNLMHGKA